MPLLISPTSSNPYFHTSSNGEIRGVGSPHTEANIKKGTEGNLGAHLTYEAFIRAGM
jgi:hypothetical protein